MRARIALAALVCAAALSNVHAALAQGSTPLDSIFIVATYDTTRDPFADLQMAMERAKADGKRILVDVGGQWCSWCHILDDYIAGHPRVAEAMRRNYVALKVNMSPRHENQRFLSRYPRIPGYPHIFVLESDGTLVRSQGTSELEEGHSYNEERMLEFLARWAPAIPQAVESAARRPARNPTQ
jgi:thiol:disulfide interchange protein